MKNLFLLLITALLSISCRTQRPVTEVPVETSIVVKDRIVEVPAIADSASIKALFECDSNNRVICTAMDELRSQYMITNTGVVANANGSMSFLYNARTNQPDKQVTAHDSIVTREVPIYKDVPYAVEKKLTWLQKTLQITGAAAWILLLLFIISRFYNPFKK